MQTNPISRALNGRFGGVLVAAIVSAQIAVTVAAILTVSWWINPRTLVLSVPLAAWAAWETWRAYR